MNFKFSSTFVSLFILSAFTLSGALLPLKSQRAEAQMTAQNVLRRNIELPSDFTKIEESNGTVVLLPVNYQEGETYPALITLPFTGGHTSSYIRGDFAAQYKDRVVNPFIVILLDAHGSPDDYASNAAWTSTIARYETQIRNNLNALGPKYNIDMSRLAVAGSSLGGDLSWAISLRNPDLFRGTIVMNSRSTWRDDSGLRRSAANESRFFMVGNEQDSKNRLPEVRAAVEELSQFGVTHYFEVLSSGENYSNGPARTGRLMAAIDYALFTD